MKNFDTGNTFPAITAVLIMVLGLLVIVGWYLNEPLLVQIHPSLVPMQYNTALCFLLSGYSLLSIVSLQSKGISISTGVAFSIGVLTLIQYLFGWNFGIDELMMEHQITVKTSHPGRMAPNTALSFLLVSIALFAGRKNQDRNVAASFTISTVVIGLAVLALAGYLFDVERAYGWASLTRMALHTASGFFVLATALLVYASGKSNFTKQFESTSWWRISHIIILSLLILVIDLATSVGMAVGLLYIIVLFISYFYHSKYTIQLVASLASALTIVGLFVSPEAELSLSAAVFNRTITVLAIWFVSYFMLKIKNAERQLSLRERDLTIQKEKLELTLSAGTVGLWEWDIQTNDLVWDNQMKILYGVNDENFTGAYDAWTTGLHPEDRERSETEIQQAVNGEQKFNTNFRVVWPDNSVHYLRATGTVFRDENGKATQMVGLNWDVTKEREASLAIEEYSKLLETKNKELNEFSYIASHDLQEPINTITAFSDLLIKQYEEKLDDTAKQYLGYIIGSGVRAKELIADLLEYNRLGKDKALKQLKMNDLVNEVVQDLSASVHEAGAKISVEKLPQLKGYEVELRLIFQNLISNAIKFIPKERTPEITVNASKQNGFVQFSVSDNGIGIQEKHFHKIFAVFRRLHSKSDYAGTGIGLAHCKKIAEMHGGKIWVESEPEKGSTFHFTVSTRL